MNIGVDIDDVTLHLVPHWIALYNADFEDNLTIDQITDWDISLFVKPECGQKIFRYIHDPSIYDNVLPVEDALWGINLLRELGNKIIYNTVSSVKDAKFNWLKNNRFYQTFDEYIVTSDKDLIKLDYLIDDNFVNVVNNHSKQKSILMDRPWNQKFVWKNRAMGWKDVIKIICPCLDLEVC